MMMENKKDHTKKLFLCSVESRCVSFTFSQAFYFFFFEYFSITLVLTHIDIACLSAHIKMFDSTSPSAYASFAPYHANVITLLNNFREISL
jgi:hypothetical protein